MKVALCFIINYEHILNKESIWKEWIEHNKDIINVYFYYKDLHKIKSNWILEHTLPPNCIYNTSYYHVIPAYISILNYALKHDIDNKWFCMLTDSCCPIISPKQFRNLFYKCHNNSIFSWKHAWWNPDFHKRGNLSKLPKEIWLANDPWFILTRENVKQVIHFTSTQHLLTQTICDGGLANETMFAVIFYFYKELNNNNDKCRIICKPTHLTDWNRLSSSTSPHVFKEVNDQDIIFIDKELEKNGHAVFIRKIAPEFPDEILRHYIYEQNKEKDQQLILVEPFEMIINRYKYKFIYILISVFIFILYFIS
jgi:hypothetical protein